MSRGGRGTGAEVRGQGLSSLFFLFCFFVCVNFGVEANVRDKKCMSGFRNHELGS